MPTTNTATTRKPYYESVIEDAGLSPVTAEELQSKFDAITRSEYDRQRTDLQNATNQYYNQLYNTQNTAMDTIRQANAQAVATGASRGVQAANELSAILGLQSESATGAAELANQATTLAQDETTAMLENVLNAETQAAEQNQALANILLQSGSVDVEGQNAQTAESQAYANIVATIEQIRQTNPQLANDLENWMNTRYSNSSSASNSDLNQPYTNFAPTFDSLTKDAAVQAFGLPENAVTVSTATLPGSNIRFKAVLVDPNELGTSEKAALDEAVAKGADSRWRYKDGYYVYMIPENAYGQGS